MRIFTGGVATETNTFCPVPTGLEDYSVQRGKATTETTGNSSFDLTRIWGPQAQAHGDELIFSLMAFAQPASLTGKRVYEALRDEMLADLRAALPVDIVLLMLHGAMVAEGYEDCEEDMIRRVREIAGPKAIIGVELDLHCHLSPAKIAAADVVISYKEYPHFDVNDRARELFDLCRQAALGRIRPKMALFDCRMIGLYPTSREPLKSFVEAMKAAERRPGVLSVSFGHGFQFADVAHVGAKVLVVADSDQALADSVARELGLQVYRLRREIGFDTLSLPMEQALSKALASAKTPVVVADQSDNIGGGAPGDATHALRWLLDRQATGVAIAIFYDPEVVRIAKKAGVGATLPLRLGGKMSMHSGDPVDIEATITAIREQYVHDFPQASGEPALFPLGDVVALRCGGIEIVVAAERCQCYSASIFSDLGIDPERKRLLIPKSAQHFHASFSKLAAEVIYMAAPGAVPPNPKLIAYRRFDTSNMYPWVEDPLGQDRPR